MPKFLSLLKTAMLRTTQIGLYYTINIMVADAPYVAGAAAAMVLT